MVMRSIGVSVQVQIVKNNSCKLPSLTVGRARLRLRVQQRPLDEVDPFLHRQHPTFLSLPWLPFECLLQVNVSVVGTMGKSTALNSDVYSLSDFKER